MNSLEDLQGRPFKAAVREEDRRWSQGIRKLPTSSWRASMERFQARGWPEGRRWAHAHITWRSHSVSIQKSGAAYTQTIWIGPDWHLEGQSGTGFSASSAHFYTIEDIGSGSEHLQLTVWEWPEGAAKPSPLWRRAPVGPSVILHGDHVFFSSVENQLRYPDVRRVSLQTGKGERVLYRQRDKRVQLTLDARGGTLFVHEANAIFQRLGELLADTGKIRWLTPVLKSTVIPVGPNMYATDRCLNTAAECWPLPAGHFIQDARMGPQESVLVSTVCDGASALWVLKGNTWSLLWDTKGEMSDVQIIHEPTEFPTFLLRRPSRPDIVAAFTPKGASASGTWGLKTLLEYPEPLRLRVIAHHSDADVPYTVVAAAEKPRALLVEAYGAYGISSRRAYPVRWLPFLAAGYAVAYVAPRGGRERGDAWWDGARTALRKAATFLDTAAAIKAIQEDVGIPAKATVFFGRSAGGWLAANIAQDHGDLVAAVYAEVPYVDVLATTSNPRLPLTQLEYDEFGDPVHRPAEKEALARISPVDTVPPGGPTSPLVVIRTGLHDAQVFPYEALKWSRALRAAGWTRVYVGIDHNGGHFAGPDAMLQQRAEDAALLDAAVQCPKMRRDRVTKRAKRSIPRSSAAPRTAAGITRSRR